MDHIGYGPQMSRASGRREIHPGADDNASGTVALMEIAQAFSMLKGKNKRTVVFQSYSAEEMGLIGSRYYCNNPTFPINSPNLQKHIFMLNMDMVGYLGKGKYDAGFSAGESSVDISTIINELGGKYSFAKSVTSRGSGGSDHASFYNKKIPIAFLHTGLHSYYHTPDDTADKINYAGVEKVAKYGFELAWKIVQSDNSPRFNYGTFKAMEYTHDHGHSETPFPKHKD
jgi:Zn-dependent M28 family amino/carboxypeptidase